MVETASSASIDSSRPVRRILEDKVAIITGANRGIGAAAAKLFSHHGAISVVNFNQTRDLADAVVADITANGDRALAFQADVTDLEQVERMVHDVFDHYGRIDALVNNARPIPMSRAGYFETSSEDVERRVLAELRSIDYTCRTVFPIMRDQGGGRIINVSSIAGRQAAPARTAYHVAKAAMEGLSKAIAQAFAPHNITVNILSPGTVLTERRLGSGEDLEPVRNATPMRKIATSADVAGGILMFALDEAALVTGQYFYVSGGTVMP